MTVHVPLGSPPRIELIGPGRHPRGQEAYQLHGLWCVHLYRWTGRILIAGREVAIAPGTASVLPADTFFTHVWPQADNVHLYAHFSVPSGAPTPVPLVQPLSDFDGWWHRFGEAAAAADRAPCRAQAETWALLWRLADRGDADREHPALRIAIEAIQNHLADLPPLAEIAERAGVSHNHLIRLFRARYGETVQAYVRRRRSERARYLLENTSKPIKAIAREVGCADSQSLNKLLRQTLGESPQRLRDGAEAGRELRASR